MDNTTMTYAQYMLSIRHVSFSTLKSYRYILNRVPKIYFNNYQRKLFLHPRELRKAFRLYISESIEKRKSLGFINFEIAAINSFIRYLRFIEGPYLPLFSKRKHQPLPLHLSLYKINRLKLALKNSSIPIAYKAAISLMINNGLYIREVLNIKTTDIDHKNGNFWVGQGDRKRNIAFAEESKDYLIAWSKQHDNILTSHYLFPFIKESIIYDYLHFLGKIICSPLTPTFLRNTAIKISFEHKFSFPYIAKYFGIQHFKTLLRFEKLATITYTSAFQAFKRMSTLVGRKSCQEALKAAKAIEGGSVFNEKKATRLYKQSHRADLPHASNH